MAIFHPYNTIFSDIFHGNTAPNRSLTAGSFNVYFSSNQRAARVSILPQLSHIKWKIWSADVGARARARSAAAGASVAAAWQAARVPPRRPSNSFMAFLSAPLRYGPYHNTE